MYSESLQTLTECAEDNDYRVYQTDGTPFTWTVFENLSYEVPAQLWKIHVTCACVELEYLCQRVLRFLVAERCSFKVPSSVEAVVLINSGGASEALIGKVVTAYPASEAEFARLVSILSDIWPQSSGPCVLSDVSSKSSSAVFGRYGVGKPRRHMVNQKGVYCFALEDPNGHLVPDVRDQRGLTPSWVTVPGVCQSQRTLNSKLLVLADGRSFCKVALLHSSPKSKVYLALHTLTACRVAIKEVRHGVAGDQLGFSAREKLFREYRFLSMLAKIANFVPAPLGFHEDEIGSSLVMADLDGTVGILLPDQMLREAMSALADLLDQLHHFGYVHRDVKLANFVYSRERSFLVDFELCVAARGEGPMGGTRAYLAPETSKQRAETPVDVYALGVTLAHALLRYDPALLPAGPGRLIALLKLCGLFSAASLVERMTTFNPQDRPTAGFVCQQLEACDWDVRRPTLANIRKFTSAAWVDRACVDSCAFTRGFRRADGGWRNAHFQKHFTCQGINLGAAGIVIGLATLQHALRRTDFDEDITAGAQFLSEASALPSSGLFTGNAGVALALSVAGKKFKCEHLIAAASRKFRHHANSPEADLFVGSAGIVFSACVISEVLGERWPLEVARRHARRLKATAVEQRGLLTWSVDDGGLRNHFIGAAHGSAGIGMALAKYGSLSRVDEYLDFGMKTLQGIAARYRGAVKIGLPYSVGRDANIAPVMNWCHGLAGYLWCLISADVDNFLCSEIEWAASLVRGAQPVGSATLCHGIAGQLELWRMLSRYSQYAEECKQRCLECVGALHILHQKRDGFVTWSSEEPDVFTPDLWVGFLGPASALAMWKSGSTDSILSGAWLRSL